MAPKRKRAEVVDINDARRLTYREADDYLDFYAFNSFRLAMGTMFCIVSPVVAVLIDGFDTADLIPEDAAELLESMSIIIFVAIAAVLFIYSGIRSEKWDFLRNEACILEASTADFVRKEKKAYQPLHKRLIAAGTAICIAAVGFALLILRLGKDEDFPFTDNLAAAIFLILVSIGVFLITMTLLRMHHFNLLMGLHGKVPKKKEEKAPAGKGGYKNEIVRKGMSVFWPTVLCFYLSMSFLTFAWGISWIIWPLAAVALGLVNLIFKER